MRLLTDSKNPIVVRRNRAAIFTLVGFVGTLTSAFALSLIGAVCIALPISLMIGLLQASQAPAILAMCVAGAAALAIWAGQYYAGRSYMDIVSRLGGEHRKEVLTPIFLPSLAIWSLFGTGIVFSGGLNFGTFAIVAGIALNVYGQRQKMIELRRGLPHITPVAKIETTSSSDFLDHLFELKTAESIEHLEQISKQCLVLIKPSAAASPDCTSALINELMKRKLRMEADELSALQLKLLDK